MPAEPGPPRRQSKPAPSDAQPPPRARRYIRVGQYKRNCPISTACGRNTLQIAELQVYEAATGAGLVKPGTTKATSDSTLTDYSGTHGPELSLDQDPGTWFGSVAGEDQAWLQLDLGEGAPYVDQLLNIVVYQRQGAGSCHEMLQCYSLDILDEQQQAGARLRSMHRAQGCATARCAPPCVPMVC
jgi:hypothetical protein